MAEIIATKFIVSFFLLTICVKFGAFLIAHANQFHSTNNSFKRLGNLREKELRMRLHRFCPRIAKRDNRPNDDEREAALLEERLFEALIADLYIEPGYHAGLVEVATPRYFLGYETYRPTDADVWRYHESNYGLQYQQEAKAKDYLFYLAEQPYTRTGNGQNTGYNEQRLAEMVGEAAFAELLAIKRKLETKEAPAKEVKTPSFTEWSGLNYKEPTAIPRRATKQPIFELGNEMELELTPSSEGVELRPLPAYHRPSPTFG